MSLEARILAGVREVAPAAWDALVGDASPFVEHGYLLACEAASATPRHGVEPRHVTLWRDGALVAAAPLYLKRDGRGEFIYDFAWEGLAQRLRAPYLPKLVSMGPFAPFDVPHLLVLPGEDRAALGSALLEAVERQQDGRAHGLHWLFVGAEDARALEARGGYARRASLHLVWENPGVATFDAWLATLRSKDRVRTRRELRRVEEAGVSIEQVEGDAISREDLALMRGYFEATCAQHGTGSDYLKPGTWDLLWAWRARLLLFFAREAGRRVGGALLVHKGDALYGRYWGSDRERPFLYFALCFHRPIMHALARGLRFVHPGAGVTPHKVARGFGPVVRASFHRVADPRLQRVIEAHAAAEALEVERVARDLA